MEIEDREGAGETSRRHADDREQLAVESDFRADDVRIRAEALAPEAVAQHHHPRGARRGVFCGEKSSAHRRVDAEEVEVVAGDDLASETFRDPVGGGQGRAEEAAEGEVGEDLVVRAVVLVVEPRHRQQSAPRAGLVALLGGEQRHQRLGIRDREPAQEERVGQGEDRDAGADADGQGDQRQSGHRRPPEEGSEGETQVAGRMFHHGLLHWRKDRATANGVRLMRARSGVLPSRVD